MSSYLDYLAEHWRLTVLRVLARAPAYRANDSVLQQALESFGLTTTRDQAKGTLAWLAEQGLITIDDMGGVIVATITERGRDVATGAAVVPGVKRPGPSSSSPR